MRLKLIYAFVGVAVLFGIFAAIAYVFGPHAPEIYITSPEGDENWQPGETHPIAWYAPGVPLKSKISIMIRRIPPPPLQEEGQEFDPILFTDLENTGSTTWKIAPHYPDGTYVLGLTAYESTPVRKSISVESKAFTITHPQLAEDLYPLYGAADWQKTEAASMQIGSVSYEGTAVYAAKIDAGMNPGKIITPFQSYFDRKLKAAGWKTANDLAAGGHVGGQSGYRKGSAVILTGFRIDYLRTPAHAPSECPCEVTLSVFSVVK